MPRLFESVALIYTFFCALTVYIVIIQTDLKASFRTEIFQLNDLTVLYQWLLSCMMFTAIAKSFLTSNFTDPTYFGFIILKPISALTRGNIMSNSRIFTISNVEIVSLNQKFWVTKSIDIMSDVWKIIFKLNKEIHCWFCLRSNTMIEARAT